MNEHEILKYALKVNQASLKIPLEVTIEGMQIPIEVLHNHDTLLPIISFYSNSISNYVLGYDVFNLNFRKSNDSLCYVISEESDDRIKDEDGKSTIIPMSLKMIFAYEGMYKAYNLHINDKFDLTNNVYQWRSIMEKIQENTLLKTNDILEMADFKIIEDYLQRNTLKQKVSK